MRSLPIFSYTGRAELDLSLRNALLAAIPGTAFFAVIQGSAYTAFVRALTKQDSIYGLLAALPLVAGVFRFLSAYLIERYRIRRRVFLAAFYLQRLIWIPFALIPYLVPGALPALRVALAVLCLSAHGIGGALGDVAFVAWLTDLVPGEIRGSYLGQRNRVGQLAAMATPLLVGWYLDAHHGFGGLTTVLIAGALLGATDIALWHWVIHPPVQASGQPLSLARMFLEPLRLPAYRKLLAFWTVNLFALGFMSPFLMVYNLEVLNLSNTEASLQLQVIPGILAFILAGTWGRCIDEFGSKPLLKLCMIGSSLMPLFWIFSTPTHPWLQLIPNIMGGAIWVGLDMAQMSLMMKILPRENRTAYIAGYGLTAWLVGNASAAMLAGFIADRLHPVVAASGVTIFGTPLVSYQVLFLISLALRWTAAYVVLPRVEEPEARSMRELLVSILPPARASRVASPPNAR
ncbi:MAG: MFS transporter [Bacteroidota bacterium]